MRKGGGKQKGSQWERDVARFFTKWVTGKETPLLFWRTPGSGSFVTNKVSTDASGDIISILPEGRFFTNVISCELKIGYDDVDLFKHFKNTKNNTLEAFWNQCLRDANQVNKYGMLIYKKKGYNAIIGIEDTLMNILKQRTELPKSITVTFDMLSPIVLFDMESFFTLLLPKHFVGIDKKDIQ